MLCFYSSSSSPRTTLNQNKLFMYNPQISFWILRKASLCDKLWICITIEYIVFVFCRFEELRQPKEVGSCLWWDEQHSLTSNLEVDSVSRELVLFILFRSLIPICIFYWRNIYKNSKGDRTFTFALVIADAFFMINNISWWREVSFPFKCFIVLLLHVCTYTNGVNIVQHIFYV